MPKTTKMWSIRSNTEKDDVTGEPLWWSNSIGWVGPEMCDCWTEKDKNTIPYLPKDSSWQPCPHDGGET